MSKFSITICGTLAFVLLTTVSGCKGEGSRVNQVVTTSIDLPIEPEPPGDQPEFPFVDHLDQAAVTGGSVGFAELFTVGDELFETQFTALDGVGALRLPDETPLPSRFSRVPPGGGRFTGPNGQACNSCHNAPFGTSAGTASSNVVQDPELAGSPPFNLRNTISLFGAGMVQRLAEEMTEELLQTRDQAAALATPGGPGITPLLFAKGVSFGSLTVTRDADGAVTVDTSAVEGVSPDLVIRAFGWKGDVPSLRHFVRGAARNELGMEADELVEKDPLGRSDPDGDGVEGEFSVGDITAITVYIAAQESPTTIARMVNQSFLPPPGGSFELSRQRGATLFGQLGCDTCHTPEMHLLDPIFEEPTLRGEGNFFDSQMDPTATHLEPLSPFSFHLGHQGDFPRPHAHPSGGLRVPLFSDLKRHDMGSELADAQAVSVVRADGSPLEVDGVPQAVATSVFLTPELWGVGNTGPWLHDGRAATLEDAILLHGTSFPPSIGDPGRSEAQEERDAFAALSEEDREAVVTFLRSLILFQVPEEE